MSNTSLTDYSAAAAAIPDEALLGSLVLFSVGGAAVNLEQAHTDLTALGLDTSMLKKRIRGIDAFKKASRELEKTFQMSEHVQLSFKVIQVGQDGDTSHRHVIAQEVSSRPGRKRRVRFDASAELVFHRAVGKGTERVEVVRHEPEGLVLNAEQQAFLDGGLDGLPRRVEHWKQHLDSHGVRSYIRDFVNSLRAIQVAPNGGLYFIRQDHKETLGRLAGWVREHGFEFRTIPLLDLVDQREMLADAFENEALERVRQMSGDIDRILADPKRRVLDATFEDYMTAYAELVVKAQETAEMLNIRSEIANKQITKFKLRVMELATRVETKDKK